MHYPDEICIRLFSKVFSSPWEGVLPGLKAVRKQLDADFDGLSHPLPDDLNATMQFCRECPGYEPEWIYRRSCDVTETVQGTP